jgi:hypothetical protein
MGFWEVVLAVIVADGIIVIGGVILAWLFKGITSGWH